MKFEKIITKQWRNSGWVEGDLYEVGWMKAKEPKKASESLKKIVKASL